MKRSRVVLVILDGWGNGPVYEGNAIKLASTPTYDKLISTFPHTELAASGESVGLPKGEAGNTETGHLNLGAGRIVYQDLPRINMAISSGSFFENKALLKAVENSRKHGSNFHIMGLIGQGGVHSSNDHLYALLAFCKKQKLAEVYLHLITDGRDSAPTSSSTYLKEVEKEIKEIGIGQIATVMGRYYAMDRDHRWERIQVAYSGIVEGVGEQTNNLLETIKSRHESGENDEFIKPILPLVNGQVLPRIKSRDSVVFYNYRIDRPRELTRALTLSDEDFVHLGDSFDPYQIKYQPTHLAPKSSPTKIFARPTRPQDLCFVTMTEYEKDLPVEIAFPPEFVEMPLSRVIALSGKRQLKLAESEKERFVTYYFNGQRELSFPGEDVKITPSPKVATYDLQPEMSGEEQTKKLLAAMKADLYDLIVINYPNPDMVAHTGNLEATIKACSYIDTCLELIYQEAMKEDDLTVLITADHGNAEELINLKHGGVDTEHSDFPVPLLVVGKQFLNKGKYLNKGVLGDVAPTILKLLGLTQPASMTGHSLL